MARRSHGPLRLLTRQPRWLVGAGVIALLLVGLFAHGLWSAIPLLALAAFLLWLLYLSWPAITPAGRAGRAAVVVLLLAAGVYRVLRP